LITKTESSTTLDKKHIDKVMTFNEKIAKMEIIKERFHHVFNATLKADANLWI
jgi:hypothetical protein